MQPDFQSLPLRDIHLPDAISWWPPAIGWWLIVFIVIAVIIAVLMYYRSVRKRRLRKNTLAALHAIKLQYYKNYNASMTMQSLSCLIRRVCITHYPRKQVASLTGPVWIEFLNGIFKDNKQYQSCSYSSAMGVVLSTLHYSRSPAKLSESFVEEIIKTTEDLIHALPLVPNKTILAPKIDPEGSQP